MDKYDVIIIGAGVSGLICGCYLAKENLKVLIVEQQEKAGGYCTSFQRGQYKFDTGVHYLGGIKNGLLGKITSELKLQETGIKFNRFDPTDKIIMPDNATYIRVNPQDSIKEFIKSFPNEKTNIKKFFRFILHDNFIYSYSKLKKLNFKQVLDEHFSSDEIKATLCMLLGNIGIPASKITALTGLMLFKEFVLDPGYYPIGGMQNFSEVLANRFRDYGGRLIFSKRVGKITTKDNKVNAILTEDEEIKAETVVSSADATETFKDILDKQDTQESMAINNLQPSASIFALYLGLKTNLTKALKESCDIWYSATYDPEGPFRNPKENIMNLELPCLMISLSSLHNNTTNKDISCITALTTAPFESEEFWSKFRDKLSEKMIKIIKQLLPQIEDSIDLKINATPLTFKRYTSNRDGATYGWAPTLEQSNSSLLPQETSVGGLYLAGHWCTKGIGTGCISGVASLGRNAARLILESKSKRWRYPLFFR